MTDRFAVSPLVVAKAHQLGPVGVDWLRRVPDLVRDLERRWSLTVGRPLTGGTSSYVAAAQRARGEAAVLKLSLPDPALAGQIRTLAAAEGRGYVRLLRSDPDAYAMLLEPLGPSLSDSGRPVDAQLQTISRLLRLAWQLPRPTGPRAEPYDKAGALGEMVLELWAGVGDGWSEAVLDRAVDCARRRSAAFVPERCVVVHGDAAAGNVLSVLSPRAGSEDGFVLVDPDGFVGDPAYDLGVAMRDWCPELLAGDPAALARHYSQVLAAGSGQDEDAIWEWGYLERVSTGLYVTSLGSPELGRPFLTAAEALCHDRG